MRSGLVIASVAVVGLLIPLPLVAHHGSAAFDTGKRVTLKGTVKEWVYSNPHCLLSLDVTGEDGKAVQWIAEGQAPNVIFPVGYRRDSFKVGDQVSVTVEPVKNGRPMGRIIQAVLADGKTLGPASSAPPAGGAAPQPLQAEPAPAGKADAGKVFWQGQMCAFCHGTVGEGGWGPDLAGRALSFAQFKRALREPWGLMPAYTDTEVNDQSIADLHAFLTGLPRVEKLGPPRWGHPPPGAPEGQRLQSTFGCSQCHGPELLVPRAWLLANDRPGGVPDAEFGVSKDAGFSYFAKMVYDHNEKYPKGTMGSFSRDRLPEVLLREIYRFMLDAGLRVRMEAALAVGTQRGANTTYTLTVANVGRVKGPTVEDITIFVRVPPGTTVVSATGTGYKGVRPLAQLGLTPALQAAPGAFTSEIPERPKPDLAGDVAVWEVPRIAAAEKQIYTVTLSGPGPTAEVLQAFGGSTVYWDRPGARLSPTQLVYRDLRRPDKGDHLRITLPPPPKQSP